MKILVTSGASFIGSAVVRYIANSIQDAVINLNNLTYAGNLDSIGSLSTSERFFFEQIDVCDKNPETSALNQYLPNATMYLTAESHLDRSIDGPAAFIATNIVGTYTFWDGTRNYWKVLAANRKNADRVHYIAIDEIYSGLDSPLCLFTETTPYVPSSLSSARNASSDHLVRVLRRNKGVLTLTASRSNNYGGRFPEKLIQLVILNALERKALLVFSKANLIPEWLFVEDHARALFKVLAVGEARETYSVSGHDEKQNIVIVHKNCELLDELKPAKNANLFEVSYRDLIRCVAGHHSRDLRYAIDASKILCELRKFVHESFESGLHKAIQWYLNNFASANRVPDRTSQRECLEFF